MPVSRLHRAGRRRIALAVAAASTAVALIAITVLVLQPVDTAATSTDAGRLGGVAAPLTLEPEPNRVVTTRNQVQAPAPAPAAPAEAAPATADPAEAEVLALVNAERTANGCAALAWDEPLAQVARLHSADMAARDYFDHTNPEGLSPFDRAAAAGTSASAENIAAGQQSAAEAMASWMASPGHRDNILNCGLTRLGVGVGHGGSYGITWTQLFG